MSLATPTTDDVDIASADRSAAPPSPLGELGRRVLEACQEFTESANPILVKEARQSLKSRQFVITFLIVLMGCWIASFGMVAAVGPQIKYGAYGGEMFFWFYSILNAALFVVVPFSAYRSLSAEKEDNTFDLLSITTLSSRQIITGKLCSAALQLTIYLSAAAPFIAFTLLMRGIEAAIIAFLIAISVLLSLLLSACGLLAGTVAHARHTQAIMSVALIAGLFLAFWGIEAMAEEMLRSGHYLIQRADFWIGVAVALTIGVTTFALIHAAAAAQIAFSTENRSTPLRIRMLVQQAFFVGWLIALMAIDARMANRRFFDLFPWAGFVGTLIAGVYWYGMGALMTGEWPHLSRRVQRSLPQSALGRAWLTWFNPGPGTGYIFAIANLWFFAAWALAGSWLLPQRPNFAWLPVDRMACASLLAWMYVVGYLGWGRLAINFVRRFTFVSMAAAFLLHVILLLAGIGVPLVIDTLSSSGQSVQNWSFKHLTNPFWTTYEVMDSSVDAIDGPVTIMVVGGLALAALLFNVRFIAAEISRHRITVPSLVLEDDAQRRPQRASGPKNPWEEPD